MMLKNVESIKTRPAKRVALDGDLVVINWVFDITALDGGTRVLDELAIQRWRNDEIAEELLPCRFSRTMATPTGG